MSVACIDCGARLTDEYEGIPRIPCPHCGGTKRSISVEILLTGVAADAVAGHVRTGPPPSPPELLIKAAIVAGTVERADGLLIQSVGAAWRHVLEILKDDPNAAYQFTPRQWEEIIAGAYSEMGFDEVILTPSSGDHGRDVIATRHGVGSIRIYDQVKAYKPGHVVPANDVRAMLGTLSGQNVSKGIITTTSTFAPRLMEDPAIAQHVPYRLELKDKDTLFPWLESLKNK